MSLAIKDWGNEGIKYLSLVLILGQQVALGIQEGMEILPSPPLAVDVFTEIFLFISFILLLSSSGRSLFSQSGLLAHQLVFPDLGTVSSCTFKITSLKYSQPSWAPMLSKTTFQGTLSTMVLKRLKSALWKSKSNWSKLMKSNHFSFHWQIFLFWNARFC